MLKILFVCSRNRLRSPTAEHHFATHPQIETASAGTDHDAVEPLTVEWISWADLIVCMERKHRDKIRSKFRDALGERPIAVLNIPDEYEYMDENLIALLDERMRRYLPE
jgi:predicted protein tyrosine phosphatase